jgi:hypothetical protein
MGDTLLILCCVVDNIDFNLIFNKQNLIYFFKK